MENKKTFGVLKITVKDLEEWNPSNKRKDKSCSIKLMACKSVKILKGGVEWSAL